MLSMAALCGTARAATYQFLEDDAEPQFNLQFGIKPAASGTLSVVFDYRDAKNFYALDFTPSTVRCVRFSTERSVWRRQCKSHRQLAGGREAAPVGHGSGCRPARGAERLRCGSGHRKIGALAAAAGPGKMRACSRWKTSIGQTTLRVCRAKTANGRPGAGRWTLTSSSEESAAAGSSKRTVSERIEMSANPFAYRSAGAQGASWTQAGRWFWDNYEAGVSVKPLARGTVGWLFIRRMRKITSRFIGVRRKAPRRAS
jgi:hypothetical protein